MDLTEHARRNQALWNANAEGDHALADRDWAAEEISWGIWNVPEAEVGALPDVDGRDVVELGCGTGYVSAWLARRGARPTGVDLSENQLATAARKQAEYGLEFPLIHASAEAVPLPDDCADVVVSEYGACLWCDPDLWLAEAARLLRPGGRLWFLTNSLLIALTTPDEGAAGDRLLRDSARAERGHVPGRGRRRVPPRPRRLDRHPRPPRLRRRRPARALRAGGRAADEVRVGDAGVGAALADEEIWTATWRS